MATTDIRGLREQILANAPHALKYRYPDSTYTSPPELLLRGVGDDAYSAVIVAETTDGKTDRLDAPSAESVENALYALLDLTADALDHVMQLWDREGAEDVKPAVKDEGDEGGEGEGEGEVEDEIEVEPQPEPVVKRKPGRPPKNTMGKNTMAATRRGEDASKAGSEADEGEVEEPKKKRGRPKKGKK